MSSQAQYESVDIVIDDLPPYGFRIVQKLMDNSLVVSKMRQGGKAEQAGLKEGDILQAVNSRNCNGFNCSQVLNLIDSASQPLVLTIKRKAGAHPLPTNQPAIVRQVDFLPKKKIQPTPPAKSHPSPEPSPQPNKGMTVPLLPTLPTTPSMSDGAAKPPTSEPTKVFVGSTYREQKDEETPKNMKFGGASSIVVDPPMNFDLFTDSQKKTYTDSAFFNDPSHKYPTLEEQVQLARKVAMSVLAPINANSKGHKMFVKAKERAWKYTTGRGSDTEEPSTEISDTLHNMPKKIAFVPKLPDDSTGERAGAMSNEELELMRLQGRKTTHTNVAPRVCFSLADDLKNMRGKGGQLFAKRQAKSETWTVGGGGGNDEAESEQIMEEENPETKVREQKMVKDKLASKHQMEKELKGDDEESAPNLGYGGVTKLDTLIKANKSVITPWEAAAEYGNIDKAFEHLEKIDSQLNEGPRSTEFQQLRRPPQTARPSSMIVQSSTGAPQHPITAEDLAKIRTSQARSPGYRPVKFNPANNSIEPPPGIPVSDV